MTRRADFPVTGPTGDATSRQQRAVDALTDVRRQKNAAATRDHNTDTSRATAALAKRAGDGPWVEGTRDDLSGTTRTT